MKTPSFNNKIVVTLNLAIVSYFIAIYLLNHFKINHVFIGVLYEMFTLPSILASGVLSIVAIKSLFKNKKHTKLRLISGVMVIITAFIVYKSLFF